VYLLQWIQFFAQTEAFGFASQNRRWRTNIHDLQSVIKVVTFGNEPGGA
jgi:hypothetical protein